MNLFAGLEEVEQKQEDVFLKGFLPFLKAFSEGLEEAEQKHELLKHLSN